MPLRELLWLAIVAFVAYQVAKWLPWLFYLLELWLE